MRTSAAIAGATTRPQPAAVEDLHLRAAAPDDAGAIHSLIVSHLAEGHLLPREREEIAIHAHRFTVIVRDARVVACAELAPLSRDVSEVRSLVVSGEARTLGLGDEIIDELVDRATTAGFEKLCAFTHAPSYFVQLGFSIVPHVWLLPASMDRYRNAPKARTGVELLALSMLPNSPLPPWPQQYTADGSVPSLASTRAQLWFSPPVTARKTRPPGLETITGMLLCVVVPSPS